VLVPDKLGTKCGTDRESCHPCRIHLLLRLRKDAQNFPYLKRFKKI
jgi:hypothetical protein